MRNLACILSALLLFVPGVSMAHIEDGLWKGQDEKGQACEMKVLQNYFENNTHHPLNERIKVEINGEEFVLRHPPVIKLAEKVAAFDHDTFESIVPHSKGAKALVVKMNHSEGAEGPTEFHVINHEYRADKRESAGCCALKLAE
jgi:hypothetical protein